MMVARPDVTDGHILIEVEPLTLVRKFRQIGPTDPEAGGILIGFRREKHLHIVEATSPQAGDKRSRVLFARGEKGHASRALKRWRETSMTADYLGEWHTHPEEQPEPSGIDRNEWGIILKRRKVPMVFLIAGTQGLWLGVGPVKRWQVAKIPTHWGWEGLS